MRNHGVDSARGLAIAVMIIANAAPYILTDIAVPLVARAVFSLAAPTFIFISGYTLRMNIEAGRPVKMLRMRAIQVLMMGVVLDALCWNSLPFGTFDVLYLIGSALLILIAMKDCSTVTLWWITAGIAAAALLAPEFIEYRFQNPDHALSIEASIRMISDPMSMAQRFLYDGWFPVIPWLALAIGGSLVRIHEPSLMRWKSHVLITGLMLILMGGLLYRQFPSLAHPVREGYLELFYPVNGPYWLILCGTGLTAGALSMHRNFSVPFITSVGTVSLFVYVLHSVAIRGYLSLASSSTPEVRFAVMGALLMGVLTIAWFLQRTSPSWRNIKWLKPLLFLIGL